MCATGVLGFAAFVTACGSQSAASDNAEAGPLTKGAAATAVMAAQGAQAAPAAASQTALPIGQGLYIADYIESCASADVLFFYDGSHYGDILRALPGDPMNSARPASADIYRIQRVSTPARGGKDQDAAFAGFTRIWKAEAVGGEVQGVKATGTGHFTWREGSPSARQMEYDDTTYRKCAFAQLSPQMQAAVRQFRPQLAGGGAQQAGASLQTPAGTAFPPIEKGYWTWSASCAQAIRENELIYIDDKTWSGAEILRINALGGNRYRLYTSFMDDAGPVISPDLEENDKSVLTIISPVSFTSLSEDSGMANTAIKYTHCPTATIPAAIRKDYEGR
ncbi:hypothetical protein [Sphingopyxis sp. NJF-3]